MKKIDKKTMLIILLIALILILFMYLEVRLSINDPIVMAEDVKISNVVIGEYTLIYKASLYTYIKEYEIKDNRVYYVKQDGLKGSTPAIDTRLEETFIPLKQLYDYGYFEYPAEDVIFGEDGI